MIHAALTLPQKQVAISFKNKMSRKIEREIERERELEREQAVNDMFSSGLKG